MKLKLSCLAIMLMALFTTIAHAQTVVISGNIRNSVSKEVVSAVSITVKGSSEGTFSDDKGNFRLTLSHSLPVTLVITSIGFESKEVEVNSSSAVNVDLVPASALGQEVVVSATRTPARILESPVTIERVSNAAIRNTSASSYYDMVGNLKGVDMVTASLTFKTPTTRGFGASGNTRFTQIINGMDNQAPGLNFSVGAVIGLIELDVDNMELLPGASSALYGPGGMNGTLLVNGKNPFKYQGLSFQVKQGVMNVGQNAGRPASPYYNWSLRWGKKVSDKFAFKIATELIQAKDWVANDYRNYKRAGSTGNVADGTRSTDPNYDGVNVYGDETTTNLKNVLNLIGQQAPFLQGYINTLPANIPVSRTGYNEKDVSDPNTINFKLSGGLYYKLGNNVEASLSGYWGTGNTLYTGSNRYSLKNLKMGQYKLEFTGKNWFARAYTTQENSGESYNLTVATQLLNEGWKASGGSNGWYAQYAQAYLAAKLAGRPEMEAQNAARSVADQGRPQPGSPRFQQLLDSVRLLPIPQGGLFLDRSDLYMVEGQYNLTDVIKFAEVLVGGNYKRYVLNSQGTLFADKPGNPIGINEYGAYVQISKNIIQDFLKITASGRYDKNENFDGRFTPRITALIKPAKDHNIRLSYQTAYRFPSTQQQWIDLDVGTGRLIGGVKDLWDKYNMSDNPVYSLESVQAGNPQVVPYTAFKPESVVSYEIGYKSLLAKKLLIDAYYYYSEYENFLSRRDVVQNKNPADMTFTDVNGFSIVVNAPGKVKANGWGIGLEYLLPSNFSVSANVSSDVLKDVPENFRAEFNTPKYRSNITVANSGFGKAKRWGFGVTWRWQDAFFYDSDFAAGDLPAINVVDAQISYKFPSIHSVVKLAANNLFNQYYRNAMGNPQVGGLYFVSFAYNIF
ncbi:MAG: TonB-dependent receptor [Bacteroidetes bacterium]|nr:MAG: TonB-dependent receptor [Bacteroidota bacterium]